MTQPTETTTPIESDALAARIKQIVERGIPKGFQVLVLGEEDLHSYSITVGVELQMKYVIGKFYLANTDYEDHLRMITRHIRDSFGETLRKLLREHFGY